MEGTAACMPEGVETAVPCIAVLTAAVFDDWAVAAHQRHEPVDVVRRRRLARAAPRAYARQVQALQAGGREGRHKHNAHMRGGPCRQAGSAVACSLNV